MPVSHAPDPCLIENGDPCPVLMPFPDEENHENVEAEEDVTKGKNKRQLQYIKAAREGKIRFQHRIKNIKLKRPYLPEPGELEFDYVLAIRNKVVLDIRNLYEERTIAKVDVCVLLFCLGYYSYRNGSTGMTVSVLAERMDRDKTAVYRSVLTLEKLGYLYRNPFGVICLSTDVVKPLSKKWTGYVKQLEAQNGI